MLRAAPKKKGKKLDWLKSFVPDPKVWDSVKVPPQTAWRLDRMKNMTYTQFWQLVKERRVDQASAPWPGLLLTLALPQHFLMAPGLACWFYSWGALVLIEAGNTALLDKPVG